MEILGECKLSRKEKEFPNATVVGKESAPIKVAVDVHQPEVKGNSRKGDRI